MLRLARIAAAVNGVGQPAPAFDATDEQVAQTVETFWAQFAKAGNPNPPGTNVWPAYAVGGDRFIVFGDTVRFRTAQLDFLDRTTGAERRRGPFMKILGLCASV